MKTLAEIRQQYPQYQDIPDVQLAKALHSKFYSDVPYSEFTKKLGFREVIDNTPQQEPMTVMEGIGETAMGALRGASRFGTTFMRPIDAATDYIKGDRGPTVSGLITGDQPLSRNQERIAAIEQFMRDHADTNSMLYKGGDLGAQIAGTAGIPGAMAKAFMGAAKFIPGVSNIAPKVVSAIESGGLRLNPAGMVGPMAKTSLAQSAGNAAIRVGGGGLGGYVMAGMVDPESAPVGALIGGGLPVAVKLAGAAGQATRAALGQKQLNPVLSKTLEDSLAAGYVAPPSLAGGGVGSRILEGVSGKYKTNQLATIKNQAVTDNLARKALGLSADAPLTSETTAAVRSAAFDAGYKPVTQSSAPMLTGKAYENALDQIANKYRGPAKSFPAAEKEAVTSLVDGYKVKMFSADDAIKTIQNLRDDAAGSFQKGDKALGRAQREIAKALEDQIERQLKVMGKNGKELLKGFRDARTLMAKAHTVEDAIREGGGVVDAKVLGRALQKGKPLSGELATIGRFANNFGDVAGIAKSGNANPLTILDMFTAGAGAGAGAPLLTALPAARVASRYGILSKPYQQAFLNPANYGKGSMQGLLSALENDPTRALLINAASQAVRQ